MSRTMLGATGSLSVVHLVLEAKSVKGTANVETSKNHSWNPELTIRNEKRFR